jgi:hypothetical protein
VSDTVWLTHPDLPDSLVEQPADSSVVIVLKARGWEEADAPQPIDPQLVELETSPFEAPPKSGAGSGRDTWADHAAALGIEVDDDMTRDEIIAAVEHTTTGDQPTTKES